MYVHVAAVCLLVKDGSMRWRSAAKGEPTFCFAFWPWKYGFVRAYLESMLQNQLFSAAELTRARVLRATIVAQALTKYNFAGRMASLARPAHKRMALYHGGFNGGVAAALLLGGAVAEGYGYPALFALSAAVTMAAALAFALSSDALEREG